MTQNDNQFSFEISKVVFQTQRADIIAFSIFLHVIKIKQR